MAYPLKCCKATPPRDTFPCAGKCTYQVSGELQNPIFFGIAPGALSSSSFCTSAKLEPKPMPPGFTARHVVMGRKTGTRRMSHRVVLVFKVMYPIKMEALRWRRRIRIAALPTRVVYPTFALNPVHCSSFSHTGTNDITHMITRVSRRSLMRKEATSYHK